MDVIKYPTAVISALKSNFKGVQMKLVNNKICLFCGKNAATKDHIPSKNLLDKPYPNNLLTIPACDKCNKSFTLDEEYFLNTLVEVSNNPTLISKKEKGGSIFKARERSKGLRQRVEV